MDDVVLCAGDGAGVTAECAVSFTTQEKAEILLVDLGVELPGSKLTSRPSQRGTRRRAYGQNLMAQEHAPISRVSSCQLPPAHFTLVPREGPPQHWL